MVVNDAPAPGRRSGAAALAAVILSVSVLTESGESGVRGKNVKYASWGCSGIIVMPFV